MIHVFRVVAAKDDDLLAIAHLDVPVHQVEPLGGGRQARELGERHLHIDALVQCPDDGAARNAVRCETPEPVNLAGLQPCPHEEHVHLISVANALACLCSP